MTRARYLACAVLALLAMSWLAVPESGAQASGLHLIRLFGHSVSVAVSPVSLGRRGGGGQAEVRITIRNLRSRSLAVSRNDLALSAQGDIFGGSWGHLPPRIGVMAHSSRALRLSFRVPTDTMAQASLYFRHAGETGAVSIPLSSRARHSSAASRNPTINTFYVSQGLGKPWGTAVDSAGNIWFAEPGCDFAPTCASDTPPGQIGELKASSHTVALYTLPRLPGNQPIFLAFDTHGNLWFTTPNNDKLGEFNPLTKKFIGQWPVTPGSGPWNLAVSGPSIWYTDHLGSAVSRFSIPTHGHQDFATPSPNSNPYGIAVSPGRVWFTENNSNVDRIGALNPVNAKIAEYPIVLPRSGTPHMIAIDPAGHPWWTEGFTRTIATLDPAAATPGRCGVPSGPCHGIRRFALPPARACSGSSHTSGIALQRNSDLVWLDDSLTAQVGSFNRVTGTFALATLSNCNAHPHDGLSLNAANAVWFDEEFSNAIGELIP